MSEIVSINQLRNNRVKADYCKTLIENSRLFNYDYSPDFFCEVLVDCYEYLTEHAEIGCLLFGISFGADHEKRQDKYIFFDQYGKIEFYEETPPSGVPVSGTRDVIDEDLTLWFLELVFSEREESSSTITPFGGYQFRKETYKDNPPKDPWFQFVKSVYEDRELHVNAMLITYLIYAMQRRGFVYIEGQWDDMILTMRFMNQDTVLTFRINRKIIDEFPTGEDPNE